MPQSTILFQSFKCLKASILPSDLDLSRTLHRGRNAIYI